MANKSVIEVDINDSSFRQFYELFQQFQGHLGELPEEWQRVNAVAGDTQEMLAGAAGALIESMRQAGEHAKQLAINMKEAGEAQKQFRLVTFEGEAGLKKMTTEAKDLANTLFGIGKFLFKLDGAALLGTAGSIFGMDKLAARAVLNQRTARGLGMSTGEYRAFQTDMGRFVDPQMLENVANAKNDLSKHVWLQRATGLSQDQIDQMNPGALTAQMTLRAHDWWASTPASQHNTAFLQNTGFGQLGMSLDDIRRSGLTDRAEILRGMNQYARDSRDLNVSDRNTDALYSFYRQLELAGQKLETVFTNRLAELGPSIGSLLTTLEKDAEILVNDIFSKENINALESGIDGLTQFLGSQEFREDVKVFAESIGTISKAIVSALRLISPGASTGTATDQNGNPTTEGPGSHQTNGLGDKQSNGGDTWLNRYFLDRNDYYGGTGQANATWGGPYYGEINPQTAKGKSNLALLGGLEKIRNLPAGLLSATVAVESSGVANAKSIKGAMGAAQLMPDTAKWLGVTDPNDFGQNVTGAAKYYAFLQDRYKGDLRKEIAAYNWGQGNLDKAVAQYGDKWEAHSPNETQNQIKRVLDLMARNQNNPVNVNVTVSNRSGSDVAVSANSGGVQ